MRKTFKYRLYPTRAQETLLESQLEECRWLYNFLLEDKKTSYEKTGKSPSMYEQHGKLPYLKRLRNSLNIVYAQVLQQVGTRIDLAFKAFFRRVKAGEKPGYPRFKGEGRYHSITYPQINGACCKVIGSSVYFPKIGDVKIKIHRRLEGSPKTCTVKRNPTGKWFAFFYCEVSTPVDMPKSKEVVGIDVGLKSFATLSTGESIDNPRFFRTDEKELARVQRKFSKTEKGSPKRYKLRKPLSRIHERIANRRHNFVHQLSRRLVNQFSFIAVEDLEINRMLHNRCLSKSISDAAWSLFFNCLFYKAANAGRVMVRINPAYTSQTCSSCGHRQKLSLSERVYKCPCCNLEICRDLNASLNILRLGLQSVGIESVKANNDS